MNYYSPNRHVNCPITAASAQTPPYLAPPAPSFSDVICLGQALLKCDSCHEYRRFRGSGIETALRQQALLLRIYLNVRSGARSGVVALTKSKLCPNVCCSGLLSQQPGRAQNQTCHRRRIYRRACSGSGLGMPQLGSEDVINKIASYCPPPVILTMKVVVFGPVPPHL